MAKLVYDAWWDTHDEYLEALSVESQTEIVRGVRLQDPVVTDKMIADAEAEAKRRLRNMKRIARRRAAIAGTNGDEEGTAHNKQTRQKVPTQRLRTDPDRSTRKTGKHGA